MAAADARTEDGQVADYRRPADRALDIVVADPNTDPNWLREMLTRENFWRSDSHAIAWLNDVRAGNVRVSERIEPVLEEVLEFFEARASASDNAVDGNAPQSAVRRSAGVRAAVSDLTEWQARLEKAIKDPGVDPKWLQEELTTRNRWANASDAAKWLTRTYLFNNPPQENRPILAAALRHFKDLTPAPAETEKMTAAGAAVRRPETRRNRGRAFLDNYSEAAHEEDSLVAGRPAVTGRHEETRATTATDGSETKVLVEATGEWQRSGPTGLPPLAWEDVLRARSWGQGIDKNGVIEADPKIRVPSKDQIDWATRERLTFFGKRDGGDFFDALAAAARAAGLDERFKDPETLRTKVIGGRADAPSPELVAKYVEAMGKAPTDEEIAKAYQILIDGAERQKVFTRIGDGSRDAVTKTLLPTLAHEHLSVPLHVVDADGHVHSYGAGPGITVAMVTGDSRRSWLGLAPTGAPLFRGPGTRPADVAGGWSRSVDDDDVSDVSVGDASPMSALVPEDISAAYRETLWRQRLRFAEVPSGTDAFLGAVLRAADGGFTVGKVFIDDVAQLRTQLVNEIDKAAGVNLDPDVNPEFVDDPDFWPVVYTAYKALYSQRPQQGQRPPGEDDATTRITRGAALDDIRTSISDPDSWPELAEAVAPYFLNRLGLSVRVVSGTGVIGRYGVGRPVYVTPLADAGQGTSRWAALPKATPRFAAGSPLGAPNMSDPVLVRLGQAADARRAALAAREAPADATDPVLVRLERIRKGWLENVTDEPVTVTDGPWSPGAFTDAVASLDSVSAGGKPSLRDERTVGGGLGLASAVELTSKLFRERGGIRPAPVSGEAGSVKAGRAGMRADQWVVAPSLRDLVRQVPSNGAAMFVSGGRTWVAARTTGGVEMAAFGPEHPEGEVVEFYPSLQAAPAQSPGLALLIDESGQVVLPKSFASAVGWDGDDLSTATIDAGPHTSAPDALPKPSQAQHEWAMENDRWLVGLQPGDDSFYKAVITAAEERLTVNGEEVTDATHLRQALAKAVRERVAERDGLNLGPFVPAAFIFTAEERIIEEFLGHNLSELRRREVYLQIADHLETGEAMNQMGEAIERPGYWEEMTRQLVPALLAANADVRLKVVEPDGRVRAYETGGGAREIVLARASSHSAGSPAWAAVTPKPGESPADVAADETVHLTATARTGEMAALDDVQTTLAGDEGLTAVPTKRGADSFFSAVLASAGGGIMLDRGTYVDTPSGLSRGMAKLVRERPDVLDSVAWSREVKEKWDSEKIISTLTDPASHDIDELAPLLIGPYLGVELRVIEPETGEIRSQGRGRQLHVAPTKGANGPHWAAFVPDRSWSLHGASPTGHKGPAGQSSSKNPWSKDTYKFVKPGAAENSWRNSTFCLGRNCVSVAVVYRKPAA